MSSAHVLSADPLTASLRASCEYFFLARNATVENGLLRVEGGGVTLVAWRGGAPFRLTLVAGIALPRPIAGRPLRLAVRLVDADAAASPPLVAVEIPTPQFIVDERVADLTHSRYPLTIALSVAAPAPGAYRLFLELNGEQCASAPLWFGREVRLTPDLASQTEQEADGGRR